MPAVPATSTDGRVARGERTRAAICTAFLDLLGEGEDRPRARQIAERAGVSVRSIFQHFEDLEALRRDVVRIQTQRVLPILGELQTPEGRDDRVAALVAQRSTLYEFIAPVRRSMRHHEGGEATDQGLRELAAVLRSQVRHQFAPELAGLPRSARDRTVAVLDATCSYDFWSHLRDTQGLAVAPARRALTAAIDAVLPPGQG